jgi:hypothetical protein
MTTPPGSGDQPSDPYQSPNEPGGWEQPQYDQPTYGQPTYGQPTYGQPTYGQPAYGQPTYPPPGYGYPAVVPTDSQGTASMIVGIVSLVLAFCYGFGLLGAPVALFLGRASMKRIDASGGQLGGRGMAQAGFVLGIIGTVLLGLAIAVVIVVIVVLAGTASTSGV